LLRTTHITTGADPALLVESGRFPSSATLLSHLFDQLIPAVITTRQPSINPSDLFRPRRAYDPAKVRNWLGYLAHHLNHRSAPDFGSGTRDFAWWQLARETLPPRTLRAALGLVFGLAVGSVLGLSDGIVGGPSGFAGAPIRIFVFGLPAGLALGSALGVRLHHGWSRLPAW
jgi:hypothetical protein